MPQGRFLFPKRGLIVPNLVVEEGAQSFLRMVFQNDLVDIDPGGGEAFHIGLCDEAGVAADAILGDLNEIATANGYARQQITRDATGWPTETLVNGQAQIQSTTETFAASGGDFSLAFSRVFLCNVASGTVGRLFAISTKIDPAILVLDGNSELISYEFYW